MNSAATEIFATTTLNSASTDRRNGPVLRTVTFRLDDVVAAGSSWESGNRRTVELTSWDGNPVEVYIHNADGSVASFAPANKGANQTARTFAKVWHAAQKSKAAAAAYAASADRSAR